MRTPSSARLPTEGFRRTGAAHGVLWAAAAGILLCWVLAACDSETPPGQDIRDRTSRNESLDPVVCRLKWLFNASVAGEIWAENSGLFRERGMEVELKEGGAEHDAIKDLELGRAQFGVASADQVIRAVAKGARVLVLAQIFQRNPLQWIFDGDKVEVKTPEDLRGLRIGVTYGGNDEAIFLALMNKYGISRGDVELYAVHYDFNPFWKGEVALWPVYRNVEGIILAQRMRRQGATPSFFDPTSFGIRFVANSLITSERMYREQPDLVRRFTEAVTAGWKGATGPDMARAARAVHRLDPETPEATILEQLRATREMILPAEPESIGAIDAGGWRQTEAILMAQGLIDREVDVRRILAGPPP